MKRLLYFAYGSNLLLRRIFMRLGKVRKIRNYTLRNWELVFNAGARGFTSFANIVPQAGSEVEGVLYELRADQIRQLDGHEAFYEKKYFVEGEDIIFVYTGDELHNHSEEKPHLEYLNILLDGCEENNLLNTYNKLVDYKINNFKLKNGHGMLKIKSL